MKNMFLAAAILLLASAAHAKGPGARHRAPRAKSSITRIDFGAPAGPDSLLPAITKKGPM